MKTRLLIASDHAGFQMKQFVMERLKDDGHNQIDWLDCGPANDQSVDYPDYAQKLCERLLKGEATFGVLICGSGQGVVMTANRFKGIRAALPWDLVSAQLSRAHNNANVVCIGARLIPAEYVLEIIKTFLNTAFLGGRHEKRIQKIDTVC